MLADFFNKCLHLFAILKFMHLFINSVSILAVTQVKKKNQLSSADFHFITTENHLKKSADWPCS